MPDAESTCKVALLLVDFMNPLDFAEADRLAPAALQAAQRTAALKKRLTAHRVPAIYANDNFGHWESDFDAVIQACIRRGGASEKLARLLAPGSEDRSVLKPRHSAFFGTPLEFLLDQLGTDWLVLTGVSADSCIMFTAHDAYLRKYKLWVPSDCVASVEAAFTRAALEHMARVLKADTRPSDAATPPFLERALADGR